MRTDLAQIRNVTDVVADPIRGIVTVAQVIADFGQHVDGFQDGQAVLPPSSQVVDLTRAGIPVELQKESSHIAAMDLVPDLLPLVAVNLVLLSGDGAENDVGKITVQLDCRVLGTGKAAAAKYSRRHLKVVAEFLTHHVGGHFRRAENRVQAAIDRHGLVNAVSGVSVVVALFLFHQGQPVRPVSVDLVCAGETERGFGAVVSRRDQQIQGADRIHIKIVIGNRGRLVVGRLRRGVNDEVRALALEKIADRLAVADIQVQVFVVAQGLGEFFDDGTCGAAGAEESLAHVIVDANDSPSLGAEQANTLRANKTARAGNNGLLVHPRWACF